jgi:hypothetical protein
MNVEEIDRQQRAPLKHVLKLGEHGHTRTFHDVASGRDQNRKEAF